MTCDTLHMLERILKSVTYLLTYLVTDRTKSRDAVASKNQTITAWSFKMVSLKNSMKLPHIYRKPF